MNSSGQRFVCIVGIDGSGKTTLAREVCRQLANDGRHYRYVHGLMSPRITRPFMLLGQRLLAPGRSKTKNFVEFTASKRLGMLKYPVIFRTYRAFSFIDCVPQALRSIALPLAQGANIVSDRYVYDVLVNLELNVEFDIDRLLQSLLWYWRFLPVPDTTFVLDVPEVVAFARKNDISHIQYLVDRRKAYLQLAQALGLKVLDGLETPHSLARHIVSAIS